MKIKHIFILFLILTISTFVRWGVRYYILPFENLENKPQILNDSTNQPQNLPLVINNMTKFDSNNYEVQYHDTVAEIESKSENGSWLQKDGKVQYLPWSQIPSFTTYYETGSFKYGSGSYIPTYSDSIYLSRTS
jgi:hypothetical protein